MAPYDDRVELLELALNGARKDATPGIQGALGQVGSKVTVSRVEEERAAVSRTYDTIKFLKEKHPDTDFVLFLGADIRNDTHKWYRWNELQEMVDIVFFSRPGYPSEGTFPVRSIETSSTAGRRALGMGDFEKAAEIFDPPVLEALKSKPEILERYKMRFETAEPQLAAKIGAQIEEAQRIDQIGEILQQLCHHEDESTNTASAITATLRARFLEDDIQGNRPGCLCEDPNKALLVFPGRAAKDQAAAIAKELGAELGESELIIFSTSDPFSVLKAPPRNRDVVLVHGDSSPQEGELLYDAPTPLGGIAAAGLQCATPWGPFRNLGASPTLGPNALRRPLRPIGGPSVRGLWNRSHRLPGLARCTGKFGMRGI